MPKQVILDDLQALDGAADADAQAGTALATVTEQSAAILKQVGDALATKTTTATDKQSKLDQLIADLQAQYGSQDAGATAENANFQMSAPGRSSRGPGFGTIGDGHLIQWAIDHKALILGAINFFAMLFKIPVPILSQIVSSGTPTPK